MTPIDKLPDGSPVENDSLALLAMSDKVSLAIYDDPWQLSLVIDNLRTIIPNICTDAL